jgi:hypothetical protein
VASDEGRAAVTRGESVSNSAPGSAGSPAPDEAAPAPDPSGEVAGAPGWREVLSVGAVVVVVVLALAFLTSLLPASLQDVVFHTPLAIVVLLVGTIGLLFWVARRQTPRV